jgi:hypothetical protein
VVVYAQEEGTLVEPLTPVEESWILETGSAQQWLTRPTDNGQGVATVSVRGATEAEVLKRLDEVTERRRPVVRRLS